MLDGSPTDSILEQQEPNNGEVMCQGVLLKGGWWGVATTTRSLPTSSSIEPFLGPFWNTSPWRFPMDSDHRSAYPSIGVAWSINCGRSRVGARATTVPGPDGSARNRASRWIPPVLGGHIPFDQEGAIQIEGPQWPHLPNPRRPSPWRRRRRRT